MSGPPPLTRPFSLPGNPPPPSPKSPQHANHAFPPPPAAAAAATNGQRADPLHPSHAFLASMLPLSDQLLANLSGVEANHPLAEVLYETCMTLRETLNLYAASSPTLLAAAAAAAPAPTTTVAAPSPSSAVTSTQQQTPQPRLHEVGLESLFTRTQKMQSVFQQRMWADRTAMTHRTNIDVAMGTTQSCSAALLSPNSSTMLSTNLAWQSFVVYKKGHELLALDNAALSSLNLNSNSHLTCSFANASNLTPVLPPSFQSPFKLLLDLRWVTGVREINSANSASSKEYGCELLVKFVDALPMGHSHGLAVSTVGSGATPQASPERFVHLRFGGDSERQKIAQVLKAAAHRNTWSDLISKQPIPDRVTLYQQLGLFPSIADQNTSSSTSSSPFAALSPLDGAFLFSPRFSSPDAATVSSSTFSLQYFPPAIPPPVTPVQAMLQALPFVNSFPVIWPSREATLLAKHKPRVLEIVIFPHQILPLNLGMITSTSPNANNWGARSSILRIWKSGGGVGGSGKDKSEKDSNSNSSEKNDKNNPGEKDGKDEMKDGRLFERTTLTGCYADFEEKESSVSLTPSELVDIRVNYDTLELELTCYITKGSNRDEGAYNGRNTRSSSLAVQPTPGTLTSPNSVTSAAAAALSASASIDLHPNSKYTTRKFLFSSGLLLRRFLDLLRWWQSSHRDVGALEKQLRIHDVELRVREMEMKNFVSTNFGRGSLSMPSLLPAAGTVATSPSTSQSPLPVCTLSSLFSAMYQAHPYSKHCFDLFTLSRDLPQNKEGTLERLQLLVRKLYACGVTASSMAAASLNLTPPPASPVAERTNGLGGMGDMRSIVCTCSGTSARPLPVPAAPSRAPPPFPGAAGNVAAGTGSSASNMPLPPTRPPPATNSCYLLFYQIFLKCNGMQDLLFLLTDVSAATSAAAIKRWSLRGLWSLFEYIKPLVSASVMPLTTMGPTISTATSPVGGQPASGSLKGGHGPTPSISDASQFGVSSLATAAGVSGNLTHFQLTSLSAVRCRTKLLTIWDEESINSLNQLFKSNFSAFITSLVSPVSRTPSNLDSSPATPAQSTTTPNSTNPPSPSSSPFLPLSFHDSLIDVLFEIVVNNVRLDTVYSSTTTTEPITTYYNAPATANSSPPSTVGTLRAPAAFGNSNVKREPRVQVLNKPLVNLQILALILHLLPHGPLAATVLTLENFTWLLNGNVGNVRELLWNLEVGNGNFGGNLYFLLSLATQWMEGANAESAATAAASPTNASGAASAAGGTGPSKKNYSTLNLMNSPIQKGSWDIFLDTSAPDSSWMAPGDHALAFNLTVTLFTTLHYHSMREYLNSGVMFLASGGSTAEEKLLTASSAGGPTSPTNDTENPNPNGAIPTSPMSPGASTLSPSYGGASQGEKEKDIRSLPPPNDSPERIRFRSSLLFRTMESLKHLNGWNESTTSVIRVMIICLLNVLRSESRSFTGNFDLTNNSGNNYAYNQFLVLLYVIEEFIFFRPLAAAVTSPQSALNTGIMADSNASLDDNEEGGAGSSLLGLNFDFGDDFEWNESTMSTNAESLLPGSTTSSVPISSCKTLGRALDVPVIDKVLDSFLSLKLATAQTAKLILGSNEKEHHNTSTVVGDGSSDKYEKKMLDLFGREFRLWTEYRTILSNISKATLAGNYKAQVDESAALLALVRSHQADRLKNLNSLANYSKKSSGFFGGGSFGGGSSSGSKAAQLRAAYGIKDGNGQGVTLHAHLFGLINKVVAKSREHQNAEGANAKRASGSIMQSGASLIASPTNGSASIPGSTAASGAAISGIVPALKEFALHQPRGPRSRASLLLNSHRITATLPDSKSEAEKLQALIRAKRSFNSIRHAKDFCEKERRRSSLFAQQGGSLIGSMMNNSSTTLSKEKSQTISSGLAAALSAAKADSANTNTAGSNGPPSTPSKVVPIPPASTPTNLTKTAPPARSPLSGATSSTADGSPPSGSSTLGSPQPPAGIPTRLPPPPPPIPSSVPSSGITPPPIPASYRTTSSHGSSGSNNSSNSSSALAQAAANGEDDYGEGDDKIGDLSPSLSSPMSTERSLSLGAFVCTVCNAPLPASAFWERAGLAYCARDFVRTFLSCMVCKERIIYSEGVEETAAEKEERHKREAVEGAMAGRQYLTLSEDRIVHNKCLKCDTCHLPLAPTPSSTASGTSSVPPQSVSLFQHSGKYYCQNDYYNMFGHKCAHCKQVITTSQSIQLSADEEEDHDNSNGDSSSSSTFYHIECFVCSVCSADLRKLEAEQEEADERAFERGEAIDPSSRAPVFQSDGQGKVYCWKDWMAKQSGSTGGAVPPPLPTAGSGSPPIGASPPPARKVSNASPKGPVGVVPPPSRSGSTTLTPNPLLATRAPSRSFAVQNDSGVTPAPAPQATTTTAGGFGPLHSTSSGFGKALTTAGASGSAPNSYVGGLSPLRTAERSGSGADSMFRVDSAESMTSIGEDLDESELSKSYSRSRS